MAVITKAERNAYATGLRLNIRDSKTEGRIGQGWLHATIQALGVSVFLLTGQYPRQASSWSRIGDRNDYSFRPASHVPFNRVQRRRAKLARVLLNALKAGEYDGDRYTISVERTCDRCGKDLGSNVMVRPNGRILGPTCWEHESGEFARKREARRARIDGFVATAAATIVRKCQGTCDVNTHCNDCDGPQ